MKKKSLLLVTILAGVLFFTGCGGKEQSITCVLESSGDGFKAKDVNVLTIKGGKAQSFKLESNMVAETAAAKRSLSQYVSLFDGTYGSLKDKKGFGYTSKSSDDTYEFTVTVDYNKVDEKEITALTGNQKQLAANYNKSRISLEKTKTETEKQGYKCTIKK